MAGLLDDDDKSLVGQLYDGLIGGFNQADNYLNTKIDAVASELKIDQGGAAYVKNLIDGSVQGLQNIGVPKSVFELEPATTKSNFAKSSDRFIQNIPAQAPEVAKGLVDLLASPIDNANVILDFIEGGVNAAIPDNSLLQKALDWTDSVIGYDNKPNQANFVELATAFKEKASTAQGRREITQEHPIDWILASAALRAGYNKLPDVSPELKQKIKNDFVEGVDPENIINNVTSILTPSQKGILGDTKFEIFAGQKAAVNLNRADDLAKAKQLESEGVDANTIWKETGFGKAQDGEWRFEIDDSRASLKDISDQPMDSNLIITGDDYLNHAGLLNALPELTDLDVKPYKFNLEGGAFGYFAKDGGNPEVGFNPMASKSLEEYSASPEAKKRFKLGKTLHEFQHAVQNIEGHAGGSSPRAEQSRILQADGAVQQARDEIDNIKKRLEEDTSLTKDEKIALFNQQKLFEEDIVNIERYAATQGDDNYRNKVLGELEAFETQKRVAMSAKERREQMPSYLLINDVLLRGDEFAEGRRLLSDAVRYEGMSPTEAQNLAAGYGRDRIMDDNLRRALENKEIIPDYVKVGGLLEEPQVSLRDYAGRSVIFPMADTSATGQTTMEVAGKELAKGSKDEGGQAFALDNPDLAWANDEKAMSALMNNLTEAQKLSKDPPLIMPWQMGGGAINFSVQMSDTMIQAARANLTDAEMKFIDDKVRAQEYLKHYKDADGNKIKPSEKVKLNPNFTGIKNVDLTKLTGMQRIALIGHLDTNAKSKIGSMLEHQLANADPTQLFTDPFTLHNIMEADLSRGILDSPHRTYNKAVGGSFKGRIKEPVSLLDLINASTKAGVPITTETIKTNIAPQNKSLMGQKLNTLLSEETIDKAIKLGEERLKRKKKNKK